MVIVIYSIIILLNLIFAYNKKNSKVVVVISSILVLLLMCGYRRPFYGDLDNYYYMYIGQQDNTVGMQIIFNVFKSIGFDFYTVHYLILITFWFVVLWMIKVFCSNWHFPIMLMSIYYIIISADQIKNHTAFIFLCVAIVCLYREKKLKAIIFLTIATTIHYSFIVYFLMILIPRKRANVVIKICVALSTVFFIMMLFKVDFMIVNVLLRGLGNVLQADSMASIKLETYFTTRTNFGFLICVAFQLLNYYLLKYSKILLNTYGDKWQVDICDFALKVNEIGFIVFPLFLYNMQWYRIIRELLLLNYCVYGNAYHCMKYSWLKRWRFLLIVLLSVIVWLVGDLCLKTKPELVIIPFFTNNLFI